MARQAISPPPPVVTFGPGPADLQTRPQSFKMRWWILTIRQKVAACGGGGLPLRRRHFIAEATSSVRSANKEQRTEADHSS